ncbi:MAG: outer membrane lipoprotein-sorting protein [Ignavibacteriales bacterium]|jgi:outer membrane lipoprotein-sorting protein|nr:outer membrane lipoprotein-sorting protein [Ignavibacteriaceae bacterium]NLH61321.1 outer membrane lipoprotein-sorting protein [Ignavibacteriales bacterium]HOJ18641.1 outer membrane lipoprotein-sorting protein [Ignavibacteriaceae bacterium]
MKLKNHGLSNLLIKRPIIAITLIVLILQCGFIFGQSADDILSKVDLNLSSNNRVFESTMNIIGRRGSRFIKSKTYAEGYKKSFTEYLYPPGDKGTKMLKLEDHLWIYSPSTDRTIQISGHLLRQSLMGSDLSYEEMMEDRKLTEMYKVNIEKKEEIFGRRCYVLYLEAKVEDVAYFTQRMWVDVERFVPLKQELYSKSGKLLKWMKSEKIQKTGERWFPMKVIYKDVMKEGDGTEFEITDIKFNQYITPSIFSKASLKK